MTVPRHITLDELTSQHQALRNDARALTRDLDPESATRRPKPGAWSVAECLRHLEITAEQYRPAIARAIADGGAHDLSAEGPFALSWVARRMIASIEPPPRLRVKAPKPFRPSSDSTTDPPALPWPQTADDYDASKARFLDLLEQSAGLDLARLSVASPVSRLIKMRLVTAFAFLAAHDRRHLWQARQVVAALRAG